MTTRTSNFSYKIKLDGEIKDLEQKLIITKKALNETFGEGNAPKGMQKVLDAIGAKIDAIKSKASTPTKSESIFSSMEGDAHAIENSLEQLGREIQNFKKKTTKEKFSLLPENEQKKVKKEVDALSKLQRAAQSVIDTLQKEADERERLKNLQDRADEIKNDQKALQTKKELYTAIKAEIEERKKAAEEQGKEYNPAKANFSDGQGGRINGAKVLAEYEELDSKLKELKASYNALTAQIGRAQNSLTAAEQTTTKSKAAFIAARTEAEKLGISLNGISTEGTKADIDALKQALEAQMQSALAAADQGIEKLSTATNNLNTSTKNTTDSIRRETEEFRNQSEAAGEVAGLVNRIKQFTGLTGAAILMRRSLQNAISTIKELDEQMTQMAVVTDLRVGDYWKQLPEHTKRANELGMAIKDVYEAETLYYQQGLKTAEVTKLSTSTLKMARIANLSAEDATNKMTAALRGFNMEINEMNADRIADVYSKLAAITASNVREISSAMTKTASIASNAGMEFETTAAFLSQIIETTRESAETAGTALKTVIARFQELKKAPEEIGEIDGEIIDANKIETALRSVGVALRDTSGQFRELDDVFIELAKKWTSLDMNTQRYIATIAAGSRQQSRFVAMMSNYKRTMELVSAANNAAGASNEQFKKTMDSLENKLAQLKNAWDTFTQGLANNELIKLAIEALTNILTAINKITEGWDSWSGAALKIGLVTAALIVSSKILRGFETHFMAARKESGFFTASLEGLKGAAVDITTWFGNLRSKIQNLHETISVTSTKINKFTMDHSWLKNALRQTTQAQNEYLATLKDEAASEATVSTTKKALIKTAMEQFTALGLTSHEARNATDMVLAGIPADQAAALAKKGLTVEIIKEKLALDSLNGELSEAQLKTLGMAGSDGIGAATKGFKQFTKTLGQSKEAWKGTFAAWKTSLSELGTSLKTFFANFGASIGYFAAAIAVLIITIVGIIHIVKAFHRNSPAGQLEEAKKRTEELSQAASKAADSFKKLSDTFSTFKTAQITIKDLTKGTQEWREAVQEINKEYLDMISLYPELAKLQTTTENGYIQFVDQQAADAIIEQANAVNEQIQAAATIAKMEELQKQQEVTFSKLSDAAKVGDTSGAGWGAWGAITSTAVAGGAGTGALIGAGIGAAGYGVGSIPVGAAGALIGAGVGLIGGTITAFATGAIQDAKETAEMEQKQLTDEFARHLTETANMSQQEIVAWLQKNSETYKNDYTAANRVAAELVSVQTELRTYGQSLQQADAQTQAYITAVQQNVLNMLNTSLYTNTELAQMSTLLTEEFINIARQNWITSVTTASKNKQLDNKNTDLGAQYYDFFQKQYGNSVSISNKGEVTYTDAENKTQTIDTETALNLFESSQALEDLRKRAELLPVALKSVGTNITGLNTAINNAFKDKAGLKLTENDISKLTKENLQQIWNSSPELQQVFATAVQFENTIQQSVELATQAFVDNTQRLNNLGLGDFSFGTDIEAQASQGLIEHISQIVAVSGPRVGKELGESINGLLSSVAIEDRDKLISQLNAINWHDADALENLPETLKAIGLNLPEEDLDDFIASAKEAAHAIHNIDMTKLNESLTELTQALDEIRTNYQGRTFEKDLYEKIIAADATLKNSFVKNLDGSYTYLGTSMDKLVNAINENTEALVQEKQDILNNKLGARGILDEMTKTKNPELDITKIGAATETMQRQWLEEFLTRANDERLNLDGISANLSSDTDVKLLSQEAVKEIINDLRGIGTAESIAQEINDTILEALTTIKLDQDAYYQTHTKTAEKAEKGQLTKEDIPEYQTSRRALISQAQQIGISEQDLQRLIRYNEALSQMEDQQKQNTKEYRRTSKAVNELMNKLAQKTSFQTMYEGLKENVEKSNELVESYKNTTSEMEKQFIVSQMMTEFGIQVTKDNYQHLAYLTDSYLQGSESGFIEIVNLAGQAAGIMGDAYEAIGEKTEQEIHDMGVEYLRFAQQMENAGYGWFDAITRQFHFGTKELLNIAKDTVEKVEQWLSPYDWLWNSERRINTELRKRNELEREYQHMQERGKVSLQDTTSNLAQQVALTRQMAEHQKDIVQNAIKELSDYTSDKNPASKYLKDKIAVGSNGQIVVDKEALYSMKYNADEGSIIEEVVDKVESLVDTALSAQDTLADLEEDMYNYTQTGKEQYASLLDRTVEALRSQYQKEIDKLSNIHDAINDAQSKLVDKIQEKIDDDRNARERADKEKSLADKATQIAYLQASGSSQLDILKLQKEYDQEQQSYTDSLIDNGIKELQDANQKAADQRQEQIDIAQAQYDYWDTNKSVQEAEQMFQDALIDIAGGKTAANTVWGQLLKGEDNVQAQSRDAMIEWDKELNNSANLALIYSGINDKGGIKDQVLSTNSDIKNFKNALTVGENSITTYTKSVKDQVDQLSFGNKRLLTDPTQFTYTKTEMDAKFSALGKKIDGIKKVTDDNNNNGENGSNKTTSRFSTYDMMLFDPGHYNQSKIEDKTLMNELDQNTAFQKHSAVYDPISPNTMYQKGFDGEYYKYTLKPSSSKEESEESLNLPRDPNDYGSMNKAIAESNLRYVKLETENMEYYYKPKSKEFPKVQSYGSDGEAMLPGGWSEFFEGNWIVRSVTQDDKGELYYWLTNPWNTLLGAFKETDLKKIGFTPSFLTGGLADFTGPAWLDGTQSAPELVLNATDTANFIALKDILSDIMRGAHERSSDKQNPEGNNYYDIEVHVDSIDSDYDVDQAVERMKELIEADAMYRNVNAIQKS